MRKLIVGVSAILAALAVAASATASSHVRDPRVPALQNKVAALQNTVATLQKNLATVYATEQCDNTWNLALTIDLSKLVAAGFGLTPYSGSWPTSGGMCAAIGRTDPSPSGYRGLQGTSSHTIFDTFKFELQAALAK